MAGMTFSKIETRGGNLVAVFERDYPVNNQDREWVFNELSLRQRIENLKRYDVDTSVEEYALGMLTKEG